MSKKSLGVLLIVVGAIMNGIPAFFGQQLYNAFGGSAITLFSILRYTSLAVIVLGIVTLVRIPTKNPQNVIVAEDIKYDGFTFAQAKEFYDDINKVGITHLDTSAMMEKVKLYIESTPKYAFALQDDLYIAMFNAVKDKFKRDAEEKKRINKEADVLRENEERQFVELTGREKRIAMLTVNQQLALYHAAELKSMANGTPMTGLPFLSSMEKEKSVAGSAIAGTMLGGSAVGMALAANAINKNMGIRERNAARAGTDLHSQFTKLQGEIWQRTLTTANMHSDLAAKYSALLDKAKVKLVDESHNPDALFAEMEFALPDSEALDDVWHSPLVDVVRCETTVTDGGSLRISVDVRLKTPLSLGQTIDGTLKAKIFAKDELVGEAFLVLPPLGIAYPNKTERLDGMPRGEVKSSRLGEGANAMTVYSPRIFGMSISGGKPEIVSLSGICASIDAEKGENYCVKIEPYKLWVMER